MAGFSRRAPPLRHGRPEAEAAPRRLTLWTATKGRLTAGHPREHSPGRVRVDTRLKGGHDGLWFYAALGLRRDASRAPHLRIDGGHGARLWRGRQVEDGQDAPK